mgnify:CR=1 FL=1
MFGFSYKSSGKSRRRRREDGNLERVNGAKCMVVEVDEIEILFALKT